MVHDGNFAAMFKSQLNTERNTFCVCQFLCPLEHAFIIQYRFVSEERTVPEAEQSIAQTNLKTQDLKQSSTVNNINTPYSPRERVRSSSAKLHVKY